MTEHPPKHYILSRILYQPDTGRFYYKPKKELTRADAGWNKRHAWKETGRAKQGRTSRVYIDGKEYKAHRVAFICMTGRCPPIVDHISGDSSDNRWTNVREANNSDNNCNRRVNYSNIGIKGIRYTPPSWMVDIRYNNFRYRKSFREFEAAIKHYLEKAPEIQGPFAVLPSLDHRGEYVPTSAV